MLDSHLLEKNPPKIRWGGVYLLMSNEGKIDYLQKLASTMNHAAWLIQGERDQLITLCELKEKQLLSQQESVRQNNEMLHTEVEKMNAQRQSYNKEIARLNQVIRDGNND